VSDRKGTRDWGLGTGEEDKTRSLPLERESGDRVKVGKQQN